MLNFVSLIIGAFALFCALVAFIPFLGWVNWFIIPVAIVGVIIGALGDGTSGRNLNIIVIAIGVGRLMLGGGFI